MFPKNDKRRLYWLIDRYLLGEISSGEFCDEFYYSYNLEIQNDMLSTLEMNTFNELSQVASRFSEYKEDHELDPLGFSTVEELKDKAIETKEKLDSQSAA